MTNENIEVSAEVEKSEAPFTIKIIKVTDLEDGGADVEFDYDEKFVAFIKEQEKMDREPTEEEIGIFFQNMLAKAVAKEDGYDLCTKSDSVAPTEDK
jgi:hypothetical protein